MYLAYINYFPDCEGNAFCQKPTRSIAWILFTWNILRCNEQCTFTRYPCSLYGLLLTRNVFIGRVIDKRGCCVTRSTCKSICTKHLTRLTPKRKKGWSHTLTISTTQALKKTVYLKIFPKITLHIRRLTLGIRRSPERRVFRLQYVNDVYYSK